MKKFSLGFIVVELMFIIISLYGIFHKDIDYEVTKGKIVYIEEYHDPINEEFWYTPYIDYSVNGIEYKNVEYGAYDSSMKVGDEVNVYYSTEDPTLIQAEGFKKVPYIVLSISLVFLIITIYISLRKY